MAGFKTLDDIDVAGKRVLVRADLNVPLRDGRVSDRTRLRRLAPTVREIAGKGGRVVLLSHFGRPKGKAVPEMSLRAVLAPLADELGLPVKFADDCVGPEAERVVAALGDGEVALLENVRFHPGEESNDPEFARALARLGDVYVNDAFSSAHRAHASVDALARLLPRAAGRLMQAEIEALESALESPSRPVAAVVGGAKVSTKLGVLGHLVQRMNVLIIGGAMANTFLFALGKPVGRSLCERDLADAARDVLDRARESGCEVVLPVDAVVAPGLDAGAEGRTVSVESVGADEAIFDVGAETVKDLKARFARCRTLLWNGPLGAFETPPFDAGTVAAAREAAALTKAGRLVSVAGGGDTVAALAHAGVADDFTYVSAAGGAFLEWLEGKELPGVAALKSAP